MNIGDTAEELLSLWGIQAGVNVVEPKRDRRGWDLQYEFPAEVSNVNNGPLDKAPPELVCLIQSKATRNPRKRREPIKLSNWRTFINSSLPCFFVIFEFDDQPDPVAAYLVHVSKEWIEKALLRLRELSAINQPGSVGRGQRQRQTGGGKKRIKELHKTTMAVTWNEADKLTELSGAGLASAIRRAVGSTSDYASQKIKWRDTLGYETHNVSGSFTISANSETYAALADFALGLTDSFPVSSLVTSDSRFGIPIHHNDAQPVEAVMKRMDTDNVNECEVTITAADGLRAVTLHCSVRTSWGMFSFLPKEYWHVRMTTPFLSFLIRTQDQSMRFAYGNFDFDRPVSLDDYASYAETLAILDDSNGGTITVRYEIPQPEGPVTLTATCQVQELEPELIENTRAAKHARLIARSFGLPSDHSVVPLELQDQKDQLAAMYSLLHPDATEVRVVSCGDGCPKTNDAVAILIAQPAGIGAVVVVALVAISGEWSAETEDGQTRLEVRGRPQVFVKGRASVLNSARFSPK